MSIAFALLAALSNAAASVAQHLANVTAPHETPGWWRQARYLIRHPTWLLGSAFLVSTFAFSATALYFGQLAVVQPLFVTELVFTLALRRLWLRDDIPVRTWAAAAVLSLGLAAFLVIADPQPGNRPTTVAHWVTVLGIWTVVTAVLLVLGRTGSPARRAAMIGAAAGVVWSVDAGFVKAATEVLRLDGVAGLFLHWPLYALVATGVLGELLVQASLHVGPLSASQPAMLIVEPLAGILVGVQLFGEELMHSPAAIVGQAVALVVMAAGVLFTSRWAPPHMTARPTGALT